MPNTMTDDPGLGNSSASVPAAQNGMTTFLHKVGAPIAWMAIGYLAATLMQRPRRSTSA